MWQENSRDFGCFQQKPIDAEKEEDDDDENLGEKKIVGTLVVSNREQFLPRELIKLIIQLCQAVNKGGNTISWDLILNHFSKRFSE